MSHKKNYVWDWLIFPNTWPVKIGTNLLGEEVLAFEYSSSNCNKGRLFLLTVGFLQMPQS